MKLPGLHIWLVCLLAWGGVGGMQAQPDSSLTKRERRLAKREAMLAQRERYLIQALSGSWHTLLDQRMAPARYTGAGAGMAFGWQTFGPHFLEEGRFAGGFYSRLRAAHGESLVHHSGGEGHYSYLFGLDSLLGGRVRPYLGADLSAWTSVRYNPRLTNSQTHMEIVGSLQLAAALAYRFRFLRQENRVLWRLRLPVTSYLYAVPAYNISSQESLGFAAPWRAFRLWSALSLDRPLGPFSRHHWRLTYEWDFYALSDETYPLARASQGLYLSLLFRL